MTIKQAIKPSSDVLVAQWLKKRSPRTVRAYEHDLALFAEYCSERNKDLLGVDSELVATYAADLRNARSANRGAAFLKWPTIRRRLRSVRSFYRWAAENGHIAADPSINIVVPHKDPRGKGGITFEEAVNAAQRDERAKAILRILHSSSLTMEQLGGARWCDFFLHPDRGICLRLTPSVESWEDVVSISEQTWELLTQWRFQNRPHYNDFVFSGGSDALQLLLREASGVA